MTQPPDRTPPERPSTSRIRKRSGPRPQPSRAASSRAASPGPVSPGGPPRKIVRARRPFLWLRRLLLASGILILLGVGVMLAAYRFGRATMPTDDPSQQQAGTETSSPSTPSGGSAAPPPPEAAPPTEDEVLSGQGFDYTQTSGGEPVFRIQAATSRQMRDDTAHLQDVGLEIYRQDGSTVKVKSQRATFREAGRTAQLEGDVLLTGWEDLVLEARALELRQEGKILASDGPVRFRYPPDLRGRAAGLQLDRRNNTVTLTGGVHISSATGGPTGLRLEGERVIYQSDDGLFRVVGKASIDYQGQSLRSHYITIETDDDGELQLLRARFEVAGGRTLTLPDGAVERITYTGDFLEMAPDQGGSGARNLKLDGGEKKAILSIADGLGGLRQLTARALTGEMKNDRLTQIEGVGAPIRLHEMLDLPRPHLLRRVCAERLRAYFLADGGLGRIELFNQIDLHDPEVHLGGGMRAGIDLVEDVLNIQGEEVLLLNEQAEISAERFVFNRAGGVIRARGGVFATLAETSLSTLAESPLGQGSGPIRISSDEALWVLDPASFTFDGAVQAWRGENLLLSEQLRGEGDLLSASGEELKTVWTPASLAVPSDENRELGGPIEVTAKRMSYDRDAHILNYGGSVRLTQGQRTLRCKDLAVHLRQGGNRAEKMLCEGAVRLEDPVEDRRAQGDLAIYRPELNQVEIFGDEVKLLDGKNELQGRYLVYDLVAGTAGLRSRAPETAEAIDPSE